MFICVKLDMTSSKVDGMVPKRLLHDKLSSCSCFNSPSYVGIIPLNRFLLRLRDSRGYNWTKSEGILPSILFPLKFKLCKKGNLKTFFGITPVNIFPPTSKSSRFFSNPISLGILPER
jgi:hypothetical protein